MNLFTRRTYNRAAGRTCLLWDELDATTDPAVRQAVYGKLQHAYNTVAVSVRPGCIPAGYDGDYERDLLITADLCWILQIFEFNIAARNTGNWTSTFNDYLPGYDENPELAAAWQKLWWSGNRAERAVLLRGHPRSRDGREPAEGIAQLTAPHAGSAVTGFLHQVADSEELLSLRPARKAAVR